MCFTPCANVREESREAPGCTEVGTRVCTACKLARYCSTVCQKQHWIAHKQTCKSVFNNPDWTPDWTTNLRMPDFFSFDEESKVHDPSPLGKGTSLWGNVPAMDVLNLERNEDDVRGDLSVAFVASGDLRNVIVTINGLPETYTGELTVVLNDRDPILSFRNALTLSILGGEQDKQEAARIALHLWYSCFLPPEYDARVSSHEQKIMTSGKDGHLDLHLSQRSTLQGKLDPDFCRIMSAASSSLTYEDIKREIQRVRYGFVRPM
ncbi:hypothetical protein OF83DRAFT_196974 [Amylostereum chailletii]|nr:hypothetical protein OF83DRAFT_196974 [Amylostereum chailletii]